MRKLFKERVEGDVYNDAYFAYYFKKSVENKDGWMYVSSFFPVSWFGIRFYAMYRFGDVRFFRVSLWPFFVHKSPLLNKQQMAESDFLLDAARERARQAEIKAAKERIYKQYK